METIRSDEAGGSYFALRRLWLYWRGGNYVRSEADAVEAYATGVAMFIVAWLFAVHVTLGDRLSLLNAVLALLLVPATWLCWTALLYPNSLLFAAARRVGLFTNLRPRDAQHALYSILSAVLSAELLVADCFAMQLIGLLWLVAVALNLGAALLLAVLAPPDQGGE